MRDNLRGIAPEEPTERIPCDAMLHAMAEPQSGAAGQSLYCVIRQYDGAPDERELRPIAERVIAEYRRAEGFRGVYVLRNAEAPSRPLSVLFTDTREHAERMFREVTQAAMPQGMSQRVVASGQTAVLAMA